MGFQITVMLTLVVYIEGLSQNLPIMQNINQAPRLLHFFIVSIVVIAVSILVTTVSLAEVGKLVRCLTTGKGFPYLR